MHTINILDTIDIDLIFRRNKNRFIDRMNLERNVLHSKILMTIQ